MVWVFIFGALYGIAFILNVKLCQYSADVRLFGAIIGVALTGVSSMIALGKNGSGLTPQDWLLPFLAMVFFFMPNYVTTVGSILQHKE